MSLYWVKGVIREVKYPLIIFLGIIVVGTITFMLAEEKSAFESLYWMIVTITTVGYGDIHPETTLGRALTMVLLLVGVGMFMYVVQSLVSVIVQKRVREVIGLEAAELKVKDHYIVCGYGRIGKIVARELQAAKTQFVVITDDSEAFKELSLADIPAISGSPTNEQVLERAKIRDAIGLISTYMEDAKNLFVVITARSLDKSMRIVSVSSSDEAIDKLYKVGASNVVSPETVVARMITRAAVKPFMCDFIDRVTLPGGVEIGHFKISEKSPLISRSLEESDIRKDTGTTVLAISRENELIENPGPEQILIEGDTLIAIGNSISLANLQILANPE